MIISGILSEKYRHKSILKLIQRVSRCNEVKLCFFTEQQTSEKNVW